MPVKKLARLVYDSRHQVGTELARALIEAAIQSVGAHHGEPYRLQVRYAWRTSICCAGAYARSRATSSSA